ncbi:MAG TPA: hypothetical protein VHD87_13440 [Acidimicrobiales bacterium]|nr:hypothetical protein [Acidimicrobiales bacterium]
MHFIRTSRHASAVITAAILIVVGVLVGLTRHDPGDHGGVQLRADQQSLQPNPTMTVPSGAIGQSPNGNKAASTPLTIGSLGAPIHAPSAIGHAPASGAGSTATTSAADTTATTTATTAPPHSTANAFAPGRIAFSSGGDVWTINPDGSDARALVSPGYDPAWSPDHSALAYVDADGEGGGLDVLTAAGDSYGLTTGVAHDSHPTWSPDGKTIAFSRIDHSQPVEYSELWAVNRDGTNMRQLTHQLCVNSDPAWSPNGKQIIFWSSSDHCDPGPTQGDIELYSLDVATGVVTRLNTATNSNGPAWSPDGKTIAFSSDGYSGVGMEICLMNADGSGAHRITNLSGDDTDPSWSPDARSIVFFRSGGIYTMKADGSGVKLLVAGANEPAWY